MEYLYGKIIYLPRKFFDPKGNKRLGKVLLLEGEHSGKVVNFDINEPPPSVAVSRNSIVRLHCEWNEEKNTVVIPNITGITPKLSPAAVMQLMKHDLPDIDPEMLIRACNADKLDEVYRLYTNDSEKFEEIVSGYLEEAMVESVTNFFSRCARDHDFDTLRRLLTAAEPGMDLHNIISIHDLLLHRARKRNVTVTEMVQKEPWIIAQAEGISFKQAEKLADHLGYKGYPVGKVAGAILNVLWSGARSGHTYVPKGTVISRVERMLNNKNLFNTIKNILNDKSLEKHFRGMWVQDLAFANKEIVDEFARYYKDEEVSEHKGRGIYLCGPFFSEIAAAERFAELVQATPELEIDEKEFLSKALAKHPGLDAEQQKAVLLVAKNPVTLLTGSAGTGKTEVIAAVVAAMSSYTNNIRLMAPTGIAAQRVNERTGLNASTIHVGVGIFKDMMDYADPDYGSPDESGIANLTVVDENGMCDIVAFNKVLQGVNRGSRLLLVGDPAQLNSPGPGDVLNNLVTLARSRHKQKQKGFGHVNLVKDHRGSAITGNANRIREGKNPEYSPTFRMIQASNNNQIELLDQLLDELEANGVPFYDILVLSSRKGESTLRMGVESLNRHLQIRFNPAGKEVNGTPFRVGDPVICIENDYQKNANHSRTESRRDVFNGERGFITETDADNNLFVQYKDGIQEYAVAESTRWLNLAYALTIHKSQGGESPVVIIVDWDNKRFTRSMLYTAVTRTKHDAGKPYSERVYFIGPDGVVEAAVGNKDELRYSKLYYRVLDNLGVYVSGNKEERSRKRIKVQMISEGAFDEPAAMIAKSV